MARRSLGVGRQARAWDTDLSASGGSLQPARPRYRSVPVRLRKSCRASGCARDFLGWGVGGVGVLERGGGARRSPAPPAPPPYVREKTFLEASMCARLEQPPRDSAPKSCERRVWATPAGGLSAPPSVAPWATGPPSPTGHPAPPLTTPSQCPGRCRCLRDSGTSER